MSNASIAHISLNSKFTPKQYPSLTTLHLDGVELTKTNLLTVQHLTLRNYPRMPLH